MKRVVSSLVVATILATACEGPLADTSAATIDGVDISIEDVRNLADAPDLAQQLQISEPAIDVPDGQLAGGPTRSALQFLVATELLASAARRQGLDVNVPSGSAAATDGASEEFAAVSGRFQAYAQALGESAAATPVDDDVLDAFLKAQGDTFDSNICLEGIAAPIGEGTDAVVALLDAGITFDEIVQQFGGQVQNFGTASAPNCVDAEGLDGLDETVQAGLTEGPIGALLQSEIVGQDGTTQTVFLRPLSRAGDRDPDVERAFARSVFSGQNSASAWIFAMAELVEVHIDSRFGDFSTTDGDLVVAPTRPSTRTVDVPDLLGG